MKRTMPPKNKATRSERLRAARKQQSSRSGPWNILTLLVGMASLLIVAAFLLIFTNPTASYNPFPPPTLPAVMIIPTATSGPPAAPTLTQTVKLLPTEGLTNTPDSGPLPTTARPLEVTATIIPTLTNTPQTDIILITALPEGSNPQTIFFTPTPTLRVSYLYPYVLQSEPYSVAASTFVPVRGCDWMGAAGQVFDLQNRPTTGVNVQLGGLLSGRPISTMATVTGSAPAYGLGGFEFKIADKPLGSTGTLWIRLVDQTGTPISARTHFDTVGNCKSNLVLINFQQKK